MDYNAISEFLTPLGLIPIIELGEGGFGKAWMAQAEIGRAITVFKTISIGEFKRNTRPCIKSEQGMQKLLREVTVCHKLRRNPHIVQIYNCWIHGPMKAIYEPMLKRFDDDSRQDHDHNYNNAQNLFQSDSSGNPAVSKEDKNTFLVIQMEYCDTDLSQWITNNPTGSPKRTNETVTEIFSQILEGLEYMHDNGVIHRDLKPSNIFITVCPTDFKICCKIGDFGLARLTPGESENFSVCIGTSSYRSPEMDGLINLPIDQKTDIFSSAFILLELLFDYKNSEKRKSDFSDIKFDGKFSSLFNSNQFPEHYDLLLKMFNRFPTDRPIALECKRLLLSSSIESERLFQKNCTKSDQSGNKQSVFGETDYTSSLAVEVNLKRQKLDSVFYGVTPLIYNFTGRDQEMSELTQVLQGPLKYALVCGLGGIGKTELVKKFVHNCTANHITWLNGETPSSLRSSIQDLSKHLGIQISTDDNKDELKILKKISNRLSNQTWLLIIDNVDDVHETFEVIIKFTINIGNIFVVVTSQSRCVLGPDAALLDIDHLLPKDAFELVNNSLDVKSPSDDIETLCFTLQYFPLALQQAIAYIIEQQRCSTLGKKYGIWDYLKEYECQKMKVFDRKPAITNEYRKTILITWNLTLEKLRRNDEHEFIQAKHILNTLSFLNPDQLHTDFLFQIHLLSPTSTANSNAEQSINRFTTTLKTLKSYSIIKVENNYISVHRLVQKLIQFYLDENTATKIMDTIITNLDLETMQKTEIQHILSVWKHIQKQHELFIKHKRLIVKIFTRLNELSLYFECLRFTENNLKLLKEKIGEDDYYALRSERCIATLTINVGKYEEALNQFQILLPKMQKILGKKDEDTLITANNLALTLTHLERYSEALEIYYEILEVRTTKNGTDNGETIRTIHNIAVVLDGQGRYADSIKLYQEVLEYRKNKLDPHHPSTLHTRNNIAFSLFRQKKYEEALIEFKNILELRVKYLGEEHSATLLTKSWLADTLRELGQEEEAFKMHSDILPLQISTLGEDHPYTIETKSKIKFLTKNK